MPTTICTGCQRLGTVAAYLAHIPMRCTVCGSAIKVTDQPVEVPIPAPVANQDSEINFAPARAVPTGSGVPLPVAGETSQPSVTVTHEPEIAPLVLSTASPLSSASLPTIELEEDMAPDRLAMYLKEIGTYREEEPVSDIPTKVTRAAIPQHLVEFVPDLAPTFDTPLQPIPPTNVEIAPTSWPAAKWQRLLARLILAAIIGLFVLAGPMWKQTLLRANLVKDGQSPTLQQTILWAPVIALVLLNFLLLQLRGQDFGKWLVRIKIVKENGRPAGLLSGFLGRELLILLGVAGFVGVGYGLSWYLQTSYPLLPGVVLAMLLASLDVMFSFSESEQCLHDRLAKTYVVDV